MAETSLKPCPFCGGEAELERDNDHHGEWFNLGCARNWHRVGPDQACPGGYIWYTAGPEEEAEAIAAWNRRATDPAVAELVDVLKDARRIVEAADLWNAGKISGQAYYHSLENHLSDKAVVRFARALLAQARGQQEKDHG